MVLQQGWIDQEVWKVWELTLRIIKSHFDADPPGVFVSIQREYTHCWRDYQGIKFGLDFDFELRCRLADVGNRGALCLFRLDLLRCVFFSFLFLIFGFCWKLLCRFELVLGWRMEWVNRSVFIRFLLSLPVDLFQDIFGLMVGDWEDGGMGWEVYCGRTFDRWATTGVMVV